MLYSRAVCKGGRPRPRPVVKKNWWGPARGGGHATKRYRIVRERLPPGALATPDGSSGLPARKGDEMTGFAARTPDEMTGKPLTICHPISKRDNKDFRR